MFSRISSVFCLAVLASPLLATASVIARTDPIPASQCTTGTLTCCNSVQQTSVTSLAQLLAGGLISIGAVLNPITGLIGLTCTPLSVLALGGNSCSAQPVCCTDNSFGGAVSLGCTPVNLNL
ncbi:hydrophobin-319 [Infundibulicybe gibba]|nr:hydrophobin-319 [Infundibulicybe gibba]